MIHHLSRHKPTKTIDMMAYIFGVGGNLAVIPQIIEAWRSDAPGLAVLSWVLFCGIGIIWLVYAVLHKQKPLIVAQAVGVSCNLLVVAGWVVNHMGSGT